MRIAGKLMGHRYRTARAAALAVLLAGNSLSCAIAQSIEEKTAVTEAPAERLDWKQSPAWTKELVIYVVATKAFTSPSGPESGNFESLRAKLPYLQELGITGIWLTGHSLSDSHHFFNVWTQYACIEPDKLDPSLGTPQQFKAMIDDAHRRGIKIFLDVITHGVMAYSPLVKQHPEWFRGGSWGMLDYDWNGGHTDLDNWWVKIWTDAVTKYGVDGFRLDLGIHSGNQNRVDLWARIRQNAVTAGHPIVIFEEGGTVIPGVTDFSQGNNRISNPVKAGELNLVFVKDVPSFYDHEFGRTGNYKVEIEHEDGSKADGSTNGAGPLRVRLDGITVDRASARVGDQVFGTDPMPEAQATAENVVRADGIPDVQLTLEDAQDTPIRNVFVSDDSGRVFPAAEKWDLNATFSDEFPHISMERQGSLVRLYIPTLDRGSTIELSAHDNGWWEGEENPYVAQGSRALFGYSLLLMPRIPLFMSGEEFDATFHPIPGLSVDTVGHKNEGKGRILLGSMLNWTELDAPSHHSMFEDVKRMLFLRTQEKAILTPILRGDIEPKLVAVPHQSDIDLPVPYMRWNEDTAIVVVANRNTEADAHLKLDIPLEKLGKTSGARYRLTDLWNGGAPKVYTARLLSVLTYTVKRDRTPRGGLDVIKVERIP